MNLKYLAVLASSAVVFAACTTAPAAPSPSPDLMPGTQTQETMILDKTIGLEEQNASEQSGVAVISKDADGKAVVTLTLSGGTFTEPQPAHIHDGSCPTPGAVKYPLTDVVDGSSVTTLAVSYDELEMMSSKMAINVHKSAKESKVYTACGDVN